MGARVLASLVLLAALIGPPSAVADEQTILHLLDYVGVDYPEAVADGKVKDADEYKEMLEFTAQAVTQLKALQEAGVIPVHLVNVPAVSLLGIFPTWQTLGAQAVVLAAVVLAFVVTRRSAASASTNASPGKPRRRDRRETMK
jgi:hypothetical protein